MILPICSSPSSPALSCTIAARSAAILKCAPCRARQGSTRSNNRSMLPTVAETCNFQPATRVGLPTTSHTSVRSGLTPSARRRVANSSAPPVLTLAGPTPARLTRGGMIERLLNSQDRSAAADLAGPHFDDLVPPPQATWRVPLAHRYLVCFRHWAIG